MRLWRVLGLAEVTQSRSLPFGRLLVAALIAVLVTTPLAYLSTIFAIYVGRYPDSAVLEQLVNPGMWLFVLLFAVPMGMPAATVFLGLLFRLRPQSMSYPMAGAWAGVSHSFVGLLLHLSWSLDANRDGTLGWITALGGFAFFLIAEGVGIPLVIASAAAGGWVAGAFFDKGDRDQ